MTATILLVVLLARPSLSLPGLFAAGNWLAVLLGYIILLLALSSSNDNSGRWEGVYKWLLTRPVVLELGAMSLCFYALQWAPQLYAWSISLPPQRSVAVKLCAAVGLAWLGYKYVETPVYGWLSARLPGVELPQGVREFAVVTCHWPHCFCVVSLGQAKTFEAQWEGAAQRTLRAQ